MSGEVSSTSFPYSQSDENLLLLATTALRALESMDNDKISTTSWTYMCPYCKFTRADRGSLLKHLKRRHADRLKTYEVEIE